MKGIISWRRVVWYSLVDASDGYDGGDGDGGGGIVWLWNSDGSGGDADGNRGGGLLWNSRSESEEESKVSGSDSCGSVE